MAEQPGEETDMAKMEKPVALAEPHLGGTSYAQDNTGRKKKKKASQTGTALGCDVILKEAKWWCLVTSLWALWRCDAHAPGGPTREQPRGCHSLRSLMAGRASRCASTPQPWPRISSP